MIERVCPFADLFIVAFLCFTALVKCVAEIVMALALKSCIGLEQRLNKRLQRLAVIF
jgi:hypothetical protein